MREIFKKYSNYEIEAKKHNGEMGTLMKRSRIGSTLYANDRNKLKRNRIKS